MKVKWGDVQTQRVRALERKWLLEGEWKKRTEG